MKFFVAVTLLALFAVALAQSQPLEPEKIEPVHVEAEPAPQPNVPRDKRSGVYVGATYTAPVAYAAYSAPYVYSSNYHYPYAYAYGSYPYYYKNYYY